MAEYGFPSHVWRANNTDSVAGLKWLDVSGSSGPHPLGDVPVNTLAIHPANADFMYAGTEVGVSATANGGADLHVFGDGLPNTAVYDLRLDSSGRLLRAATHGTGLWERLLDNSATPTSAIGLRKHLLDDRWWPPASGLTLPYADDGNLVTAGQLLRWWHGPDIKLDAPEGVPPVYQLPPSRIDFVTFETALAHRNAGDGNMNRVVVQVHNRGTRAARDVRIILLWVSAGQTFPDLPAAFWTDPTQSGDWSVLGSTVIAEISPMQPTIVYWETPFPDDVAPCFLVIADYDGIPKEHRKTAIADLVPIEPRVSVKNVQKLIVLQTTQDLNWYWTALSTGANRAETIRLRISDPESWHTVIVLPEGLVPTATEGLKAEPLPPAVREDLIKGGIRAGDLAGSAWRLAASLSRLEFAPAPQATSGLLVFLPRTGGNNDALDIVHEANGAVFSGRTLALRTVPA